MRADGGAMGTACLRAAGFPRGKARFRSFGSDPRQPFGYPPMWKKIAAIYESRSRSLAGLYSFRALGEHAEIVTPFLDPANERITLLVRAEGNSYLLCDRGLGSRIVDQSGRSDGGGILEQTRRDYGLSRSRHYLYVVCEERDLLLKQFRLCNALVALGERLASLPRR